MSKCTGPSGPSDWSAQADQLAKESAAEAAAALLELRSERGKGRPGSVGQVERREREARQGGEQLVGVGGRIRQAERELEEQRVRVEREHARLLVEVVEVFLVALGVPFGPAARAGCWPGCCARPAMPAAGACPEDA